jgi:hypothetical protein
MMRTVVVAAVAAMVVTPMMAAGQEWRDVTLSRQLESNDGLRVRVEYGAGRVTVRSVDEGLLYRMNLKYDEDSFEPVAELTGDRLKLGVESLGRSTRIRNRERGHLELELARGIPMDLDLNFGAVRTEIDLAGLALTDLALTTGASESRVTISEPNPVRMGTATFEAGAAEFRATQLGNLKAELIEVGAGVGSIMLGFGGRWEQDARVSIDMGLGSLELRIPEGLGVRLRKDSFLTALDSEGLIKRGDVYESLDYEDADYRIDIDLNAAFGSVSVVWIDPDN